MSRSTGRKKKLDLGPVLTPLPYRRDRKGGHDADGFGYCLEQLQQFHTGFFCRALSAALNFLDLF